MYAIVEYIDNTMEKFYIIEISDNYFELDKRLQMCRKLCVYKKHKKLFRIIKIK